jgi:3-methyladenine DNA glycosylase Tag
VSIFGVSQDDLDEAVKSMKQAASFYDKYRDARATENAKDIEALWDDLFLLMQHLGVEFHTVEKHRVVRKKAKR